MKTKHFVCALAVVAIMLAGYGQAVAATYYVATTGSNANPGSEASPWLTVNYGVSQLAAGDTLIVKSGTYAEALSDTIPSGTSAAALVTVQANPGDTVVLAPASGTNVVRISGSTDQYIVVDGFTLDGSNVTGDVVSVENLASNVTVTNCVVANGPARGVYLSGTSLALTQSTVHSNGTEGVYLAGDDNLLDTLEIYGNGGDGVNLFSGSHPHVWNVISRNNTGNGFYLSGTYAHVYCNTAYANGGKGILLNTTQFRSEFGNNICWQNTGGDTIANAGDRPRVVNNILGIDPLFVNAAGGDFRLQATSPAIDAGHWGIGMGSGGVWTETGCPDHDFDGNPRPSAIRYDCGAFEYQQEHAVTAGDFYTDPPTLNAISFKWYVSGDENRTAKVTVQYRPVGSGTWLTGMDFLRINNEWTARGYSTEWITPNMLAGSIINLQEDTEYEVLLTMTDPDGGSGNGATQNVTVRTRKVPEAATTGTTRHVYTPDWAGVKATPNYTTIQAAYDDCVAGDIVVVHAGNYNQSLTFDKVATEAAPIVIRGAGDGEAKIQGTGNIAILATGSAHHIIEDLTIYDADEIITAQPATALTIRRCKIHTVGNYGIRALNNSARDFYVVDNEFSGPTTEWHPHGSNPGTHALWLQGQGHVIAYNTIHDWWDGIDFNNGPPPADPTLQNGASDFHNNLIYNCMDDCIELDYSVHNTRTYENFMYNTFMGISTQPVYGGPAYIYRNVVFNNTNSPLKLNLQPAGLIIVNNTFVMASGLDISYISNCWIYNNVAAGYMGEWTLEAGTHTPEYYGQDFNAYRVFAATRERSWLWNYEYAFGPLPTGSNWSAQSATLDLAEFWKYSHQDGNSIDTVSDSDFLNIIAPTGTDVPLPAGLDLRLTASAVQIDGGTTLPIFSQITEGYAGLAPDIGAYEYGDDLPIYGIRPVDPNNLTSYFVATTGNDAGAGTEADPFQTIGKALSFARPGISITIREGTYAEAIELSTAGGLSGITIDIQPATGETVVLAPTTGVNVVALDGTAADYINISNLVLDATNVSGAAVLIGSGAEHNTLLNCEVINAATDGVVLESAYNTVEGCSIHANAGDGVAVADPVGLAANYNTVCGNTIYANGGAGISIEGATGAAVSGWDGGGPLVCNNLVYGNLCGIRVLANTSYAKVLNNSAVDNTQYPVRIDASTCVNTQVINNAAVAVSSGYASIPNAGTATTLATNYVSATDPGFVSRAGNDYHLAAQSGPLFDTGTVVAEVTEGFDGVSRPQGDAYDIGAYELFVPILTFYVATDGDDSNRGLIDEPFLTITRGLQELGPGKTLIIEAGTYAEAIIDNAGAGDAVSPATIKAADGQTVVLAPSGTTNVIKLAGIDTHHIVIDGLTINAAGVSSHAVEISAGANTITMQNCEVSNSIDSGVRIFSSAGENSDYNQLLNLTVHNCGNSSSDHGIHVSSRYNVIDGCHAYGMPSGAGITIADTALAANYNTVRNNLTHNNGSAGIAVQECTGGAVTGWPGGGALVYNNVSYANNFGLMLNNNAASPRIFNNTLDDNNFYGMFIGASTVSNAQITNNIVITKSGSIYPPILNTGTGTVLSNNLTGSGIDPGFVDKAGRDYHLTSTASTAIDQGATLTAVPDDKDGTTRPQGSAYDIGAYEYAVFVSGDLNKDGQVEFLEAFFTVANIGLTPATWEDGDFDGNGTVDFFPDAFEAVANIGYGQ